MRYPIKGYHKHMAPDGEETDAYIIGIKVYRSRRLPKGNRRCTIDMMIREEKRLPENQTFPWTILKKEIHFQEQIFRLEVIMLTPEKDTLFTKMFAKVSLFEYQTGKDSTIFIRMQTVVLS